MLKFKLICTGKLKERFYSDACAEYIKRLRSYCAPEVVELPEIVGKPDGLAREADRILAAIPAGASVAALCIEGRQLSSEELAEWIGEKESAGTAAVVFIIGSSDGLDEAVKRRAELRLSMSRMTFPHHLARVMALEQFYRALSINAGSKYHK